MGAREYASLLRAALSGEPPSRRKVPKSMFPDALPPSTRRSVLAAVHDGALSKAAALLASPQPIDDPLSAEQAYIPHVQHYRTFLSAQRPQGM